MKKERERERRRKRRLRNTRARRNLGVETKQRKVPGVGLVEASRTLQSKPISTMSPTRNLQHLLPHTQMSSVSGNRRKLCSTSGSAWAFRTQPNKIKSSVGAGSQRQTTIYYTQSVSGTAKPRTRLSVPPSLAKGNVEITRLTPPAHLPLSKPISQSYNTI